MTPEQQQIAIAIACGWTTIKQGTNRHPCFQQEIDYGPTGIRPDQQAECYLPNYCHDLNAMHEAEKVLLSMCENDPQEVLWIDYLSNLLFAAPCCLREHATAAQRAEAFLRTLNLWTP